MILSVAVSFKSMPSSSRSGRSARPVEKPPVHRGSVKSQKSDGRASFNAICEPEDKPAELRR